MNRRLPVLLLTLLGLDLGCASRRSRRGNSALARELVAADAAFAQRADAEKEEEALRRLLDLQSRYPGEPGVMWRVSRAYTLRGYRAGPEAGEPDLRTGREVALRCLKLQPEFRGVVEGAGGTVTAEAVSRLGPDERPCMLWATVAWARWLHWQGPAGAALDLEAVEALGARGVAVGGGLPDLVWEAQGLSASLRPALLGGDPAAASIHFELAREAAPDRLTLTVDQAVYALSRGGAPEEATPLLRQVVDAAERTDSEHAAENQRARERARAALDAQRAD